MLLFIEYDNIIAYARECRLHYSGLMTNQGTEYARLLTPEYNCHYRFATGEDKIGSFVIYAFKKELNIKLKNKYGNLNLPVYLKEKSLIYRNLHFQFQILREMLPLYLSLIIL